MGVSLDPLRFNSLLALWILWTTFQVKNNVKSAPASTALTLVLHQSRNTHTTSHRWRKEWRTKENKGKLWLNHDANIGAAAVGKKGTSWDEATSSNAKIKPVALAVIELRLSEGISKWVREWVSQSVENSPNWIFFQNSVATFWNGIGMIWRHLMSNLYYTKYILSWFWDDILGQEIPNLCTVTVWLYTPATEHR